MVYRWDIGTFELLDVTDPVEGWRKGSLRFGPQGERLKGAWRLFRMKGRKEQGKPLWLLQKTDDEFAVAGHVAEIIGEKRAQKSGRKKA